MHTHTKGETPVWAPSPVLTLFLNVAYIYFFCSGSRFLYFIQSI